MVVLSLHSFGRGQAGTLYHGHHNVTDDFLHHQLAILSGPIIHPAFRCSLQLLLGWHTLENFPPQLETRKTCKGVVVKVTDLEWVNGQPVCHEKLVALRGLT